MAQAPTHSLPSYLDAEHLGPWGIYLQQVDRVTPYLGNLARWVAACLAGTPVRAAPHRQLRFGWMFVLTLYGLLLLFDGRYRDFPLGLFWPPALGYFLAALVDGDGAWAPTPEERFMACLMPLMAAFAVVEDVGLNPGSWLWLGANLTLGLATLVAWRRTAGLRAHQAQAAHQ